MGICNVTFVAYGWPVYTLDINTCMYTIEFYIQAWTLMGALYSYAGLISHVCRCIALAAPESKFERRMTLPRHILHVTSYHCTTLVLNSTTCTCVNTISKRRF